MKDFSKHAGKWVAVDAEMNVLLASDDFGEVCRVEGARVFKVPAPGGPRYRVPSVKYGDRP